MARAVFTVNDVSIAGKNAAGVAGTNQGAQFANNGHCFLQVVNGNAASRVLTVQTAATYGGYALADASVTCVGSGTNGGWTFVGPFPTAVFNVPSGADEGYVYLDFPAGQESDLTVTVFRLTGF